MSRCLLILATLALGPACAITPPTPEEILESTGTAIDHFEGKAPSLVFLHGWSCNRQHWKEQVPRFKGEYEIVTIDLAGHGESTKQKKEWTVPGLADEVVEVIEALDLKKVILIGHSMGGSVALFVAPKIPDRVLGIIGVDCLHNADYPITKQQIDSVISSFEKDFPGAMNGFFDRLFASRPEAVEIKGFVKETIRGARPEVAIGLMRSYLETDFPRAFRDARVPIRCINAATPYTTEIETNRKYADFDAVLMEDVTHFLMLEKPDPFNVLLRKAIEELSPQVSRDR